MVKTVFTLTLPLIPKDKCFQKLNATQCPNTNLVDDIISLILCLANSTVITFVKLLAWLDFCLR